MTVGDALALWLVGGTGLILLLLILVELHGLVRDVLGYLRDRQNLPPVAASPTGNVAEDVPQDTDAEQGIEAQAAAVLTPHRRRGELRVVLGGRDPRSAA